MGNDNNEAKIVSFELSPPKIEFFSITQLCDTTSKPVDKCDCAVCSKAVIDRSYDEKGCLSTVIEDKSKNQ